MISIPDNAGRVLDTLHQAGYEAYIVGGCVRDAVLGQKPSDWDITTDALPGEVKKLFRRVIPTGEEHGTVTVMFGKTGVEVTTYRVDGIYEDGRHPSGVTFTKSLTEDLRRRDFTINAMAYSREDGLIDPFDGQGDLKKGVVRCVGKASERFEEDALRILRAYRFAAKLGFSLDGETEEAGRVLAGNLKKISAERIRDELLKLIVSPHPEWMTGMYRAGITAQFLPEFDRCMETPQNTPWHSMGVGEHTVASMCGVRADKVLRLTMLLHDIAKPLRRSTDEEGRDHFYGHEKASADLARTILRRLRADNRTIALVCNLIRHHDLLREWVGTKASLRKMVNRVGKDAFPLLFEVMRADCLAKAPDRQTDLLERLRCMEESFDEVVKASDPVELKDLAVSGKDLLQAGIAPGKTVGDVLHRMLDDVLETPEHNTKDYLLDERRLHRWEKMQPGKK